MQATADRLRRDKKTIGLVPTMGFLHAGHIRLIEEARQTCDTLVVSIFVNPVQFGPHEDFDKYPRDLEHDKSLLINSGTDILFCPAVEEMYPGEQKTYVFTEDLAQKLCGVSRPTHFRGVTTVVAKLFNIIKPHVAVFGQKDAQQALILKKMVTDLNFDLNMIVVPTVREPDGLALSSRNQYLSPEERKAAPEIYRALMQARNMIANGMRARKNIEAYIRDILNTVPHLRIEYIAVVDTGSLEPVEQISGGAMIATAVYCGTTRLIDNIIIDETG